MWSVENNHLHAAHLGLSLPQDNRLPWNPWSTVNFNEVGNDQNRQLWNPWTSAVFPDSNSYENRQLWNTWYEDPKMYGNLESQPGSFVSDEGMIFQNISNENRLKNYQNFRRNEDFLPRRKNKKSRKRNRALKTINNVNSSHGLQEQEQRWNRVPVMNWSKTNVSSIPFEKNLHNPFRFNKQYTINPRTNSTHGKFTNDKSNSSGSKVTTKSTAPRDNFESRNLSNFSQNDVGNSAPHSSNNLNNNNKSTIMENKTNPSTSSANSKNIAGVHESNNEDITYLFTVDCSSEAKMVLEVDLRSNEINLVPNKNSNKANLNKKKDVKDHKSVSEKPEVTQSQTSRKRKFSNSNDKNSKRADYQPECMACNMLYNDVISKCETMHISSSCSHIFCRPCISKDENGKICPACGAKFILLRKLYL